MILGEDQILSILQQFLNLIGQCGNNFRHSVMTSMILADQLDYRN